jgi:hypothetical protein
MTDTAAPRRCAATNRRGQPCNAPPMRDRDFCCSHDPIRPDETRFGSTEQAAAAAQLGGRPRIPRPREVAQRLVEENVAAVLRPHWLVLGYDVVAGEDGLVLARVPGGGAKLTASWQGEVSVSPHDDLMTMVTASERLLDRVYGKPRQALEHTGAGGGPIDVRDGRSDLRKLSTAELDALEVLLEKAEPDPQGTQ